MAVPPAPTGLPVAFGADGVVVDLRGRDLLLGPAGGAVVAGALLLAVALAMTTLGPLPLGMMPLALLALPAWMVGLGYLMVSLLEVALNAPRRTRLRCDHEVIILETRIHGMLREVERIPLARVVECRVGADGLELVRRDAPARVVPADGHRLGDLAWVAALIEEAVRQRAAFEAEVDGIRQVACRRDLLRLAARGQAAGTDHTS